MNCWPINGPCKLWITATIINRVVFQTERNVFMNTKRVQYPGSFSFYSGIRVMFNCGLLLSKSVTLYFSVALLFKSYAYSVFVFFLNSLNRYRQLTSDCIMIVGGNTL